MKNFKLLISFDGRLSVQRVSAFDIHSAMDTIRSNRPGETAVLVKQLED